MIAVELPHAHVRFTERAGGVSEGPYASLNLGLWTDDDPAAVAENRQRVAREVGVARERFAQGFQVHGTAVRRLHRAPEVTADLAQADGQATRARDVAPVVLTADCLPIALAADGAVAMIHAGWRGLAGGILAEGVRALGDLGGRGPVTAAIGPGAGACCYEVGEEVHAAFGGFARHGDRLDLKAIARRDLEAAGAAEVVDVGLCSMCDPERFFSHRRSGGVTGRQAGIAWRA